MGFVGSIDSGCRKGIVMGEGDGVLLRDRLIGVDWFQDRGVLLEL
jgi:hypothetical protein